MTLFRTSPTRKKETKKNQLIFSRRKAGVCIRRRSQKFITAGATSYYALRADRTGLRKSQNGISTTLFLDMLGKEKRDKEKPIDFLAPESRGVHPAAQSSMGATSYELSQSQYGCRITQHGEQRESNRNNIHAMEKDKRTWFSSPAELHTRICSQNVDLRGVLQPRFEWTVGQLFVEFGHQLF